MGAFGRPPLLMPAAYPRKHSGACLVVGYAPDVHVDVARARELRPGVPMLGVKYAACLYQEIEHVWTQHLEQVEAIRSRAGRPIFVHARPKGNQRKRSFTAIKLAEDVDYVWPNLAWVGASSGFAAALWARHGMGFDEVILCGVPMEHGGYCDEVGAFKKLYRREATSFVPESSLNHWYDSIRNYIATGKTAGIKSMSGWTSRVLGSPA